MKLMQHEIKTVVRTLSFELDKETLQDLNENLQDLLPGAPVVTEEDIAKMWLRGWSPKEWAQEWSETKKELGDKWLWDWVYDYILNMFYDDAYVIDEETIGRGIKNTIKKQVAKNSPLFIWSRFRRHHV